MKTIKERAREVTVVAETDVLVVGSGPGGRTRRQKDHLTCQCVYA